MRISDWSSDVCSSDLSFRIPMIIRNPDRPADATRGEIVDHYTETVGTMPTILEWIGAEIPRQCDGRSLLDFTYGTVPADWRTEVHYEFDFSDSFYSTPQGVLGTAMDQSPLAVERGSSSCRESVCQYA